MYKNRKEALSEAFKSIIFVIKFFQASFATRPTIAGCLKWILSEGLFKPNVDEIVFFDQQKAGIGFIVRDHQSYNDCKLG